MDNIQNVLETRARLYTVLGRLYQTEVTAESLESFKAVRFPEDTGNDCMNKSSAELNAAFAALKEEDLDNLAADYAHTFLAAGVAEGKAAFPFESVYTSEGGLIMQDAYEKVLKLLRAEGLTPAAKDLLPDHLGIELELMGHYSDAAARAMAANDIVAAEAAMDKSAEFLRTHLLNWTSVFFRDLRNTAETPLYKALGGVTAGFIEEDAKWLLG